ncbi:hypothetical protein [Burkholderia cepacia]|uniref:hypothetical protein n=1 Tax=Burkholderia cepacia TaxID=292 RepID=UPI001CF1671C|nr:hypothetical protein [Burkholderia cepacia]MCA8355613.1 hypothetical protein [Burkholderia cepacia]
MEQPAHRADPAAIRPYRVHLYVVVRVAVDGVHAASQTDAIAVAHQAFDPSSSVPGGEFADEIVGALVDDEGDTEFMNSTFYVPCLHGPDAWVPEAPINESGARVAAHHTAIRFFDELLESVESLSAISDVHGPSTLANLMYLQHAILTDGSIELTHDERAVVEILQGLPSADQWLTYVRQLSAG